MERDLRPAIADHGFRPPVLSVPVGKVTPGTERSPTGLLGPQWLNRMQSFGYTFNAAGACTHCRDVHPGMVGTVAVTDRREPSSSVLPSWAP